MSLRIPLAIVTALAITALPATAAARKLRPAPDSAATIAAATGLGHVRATAPRLSLPRDRGVNVAKLRHAKAGKKRARKHARAVLPSGKTVDARVLLLSANGNEPTYIWWKNMLATEGVPFDAVIVRDTAVTAPITTSFLQNSSTSGRYQAVVLATGSLLDCSSDPCAETMTPAAWTALQTYERDFAVREIGGYGWPGPSYGLNWGGNCGNKSQINLTVTAAGASTFADLAGTFPTDKAVWGCETTPLTGSSWQTMIAGPNGAVVGTYVRTDGVETMFNSIDGSDWTIHSKLLFHGMLNWVTKGVYLGTHRNFLGIDVDDIFLPNDRWDPATHALDPDEDSLIRMTSADVLRAVAWQRQTGVRLNLLFNGDGADPGKGRRGRGGDQLTAALLSTRNEFNWTSHTFTHAFLDPLDQRAIEDEIRKNIDFAKKNHLPIDPTELTTGQHSGLNNSAMPAALARTGIKTIGADASIKNDQYLIGATQTLPRHPTGIYYNVGTRAEQLDEYNYLNYTACNPSTNLGCLPAVADWNTYVSNEAAMILRHILDNDPRPHYVHQSNLAEEGTMYPVINEVLQRYRNYLKVPFVQLDYTDAAGTLKQQAAWKAALAAKSVSGTISATGLAVTSSVSGLAVPVSGTRVGDTYAGVRSGWQPVNAGTTQLGL